MIIFTVEKLGPANDFFLPSNQYVASPPPGSGRANMRDLTTTSGQIPPPLCVQIPQSTGVFCPKQLHTTQSRVKSPSMGPTFQVN